MMKRKYDTRNKRSFIFIAVLMVAIIGIFSLFIYKYTSVSKISYKIEAGSVIQDVMKNYIVVDEDAVLKIRWNDRYYLEYQDEKINLGKKVIAYNTITGELKLYGTFYEINSEGKVIENTKETVLPNTTDCKFYKLDDREYLLVDSKIFSHDRKIEANGYLLVELDKLGNAKLSNNKLNLKTITPTILMTSLYKFDINNEILSYDKYNINLKKIIGSSNEYVEEVEEEEDDGNKGGNGNALTGDGTGNTGNGNGNGTGTGIGNGIGTGVGPGDVINNNNTGSEVSKEELMDKVKMTSVIRIVEGLTSIDVDYVIYDPYGEYASVYVEVVSNDKIEKIHLSRNDTHFALNNLTANTKYKLNFVYTTNDTETGDLIPNTFASYEVSTLLPKYSISIYKISRVYNKLTYKVDLQEGFAISKVNVELSFKYKEFNPETEEETEITVKENSSVDVKTNDKYVLGEIDISKYTIDPDTLIKLTIKNVETGSGKIELNDTYSFRYGGN